MRRAGLAVILLLAGAVAFGPGAAVAQVAQQDRAQTLADIRQELTLLWTQVQQLRTELSTTGFPQGAPGSGGPLERLDTIEAELARLTSKTEELEFRIDRITRDGTNRIGDLEFRLCELETGCDIAALGDTPSLGGIDNASAIPQPAPPPAQGGPALAVGEEADYQAAEDAFEAGDFRTAAQLFASFAATYPGGPLTAQAHYLRGESLESLGEMSNAARAYLDAFTSAPAGGIAPDALFKLGAALGALGQTQDACVTLGEVVTRFPAAEAAMDAQSARTELGCG